METKHHEFSVESNTEMKESAKKNAAKRRFGQGLVEFAFVIPIFLLLLFGIVEFGRYLTAIITINTASREASRYAAAVGKNEAGLPFYRDCTGIMNAATRQGLFATFNDIDIRYDHGPDDPTAWDDLPSCASITTVGLADRVRVRVQGEYRPLILFTELYLPLESTTSRTIVTKLDVRSTQYVIDTPEPEETPGLDLCAGLSMSPVQGDTPLSYHFTVTNSTPPGQDFIAFFDEIYFSHTEAKNKNYFREIKITDITDPDYPVVLVYETYSNADEEFFFSYRPYNLNLLDPRTGERLGVPEESTYRIDFSFSTDKISWSVVKVTFYNVDCPLIRP